MNEPVKLPPMPSKTREILSVIYRFRQKWQHPTRDERWWRACAQEMAEISGRFGRDPFCDDLLVACYTDIERELKGERVL